MVFTCDVTISGYFIWLTDQVYVKLRSWAVGAASVNMASKLNGIWIKRVIQGFILIHLFSTWLASWLWLSMVEQKKITNCKELEW